MVSPAGAGRRARADGAGRAFDRQAFWRAASGIFRSPVGSDYLKFPVIRKRSSRRDLRAPRAGTAGIHTTILTNGDRRRRVCVGSGLGVLRNLMNHRQLQHGHSLAFSELRHEHVASVWEFNRIMVTMRNIRVYRAEEFPNSETGCSRPNPSVFVFDVLGECYSVPGSMQTATASSLSDAKPRVAVPRNVVVTSVSPTWAGRVATACRL
jgi:hypothetical protein